MKWRSRSSEEQDSKDLVVREEILMTRAGITLASRFFWGGVLKMEARAASQPAQPSPALGGGWTGGRLLDRGANVAGYRCRDPL